MIVNELFGFSKRSNNSYTNNPYAVMSRPEPAPVPADEPTVTDTETDTEPNTAPASSMGNMTRQLAARGQSLTSTGGATIATGRGVRHAASPLNPNQPVYPSATKPAAQPAAPATTTALAATTAAKAPATQPAGFNAANVMKMPGMEKYAKPAAPAKTPNFAGPGGYGKVTTSFKPPSLTKQLQVAESLTWSKNFDPGMTLLKKMRK